MARPSKRSRISINPEPLQGGLPNYVSERFTAQLSDGSVLAHDLYRRERSGPSVIIIHEAFGLTASSLGVAEHVWRAGMTPVLPLLVGEPLPGKFAGIRNFGTVCVRREFGAFVRNKATKIVDWLTALAEDEFMVSGERSVGVIGMCFSGGYALAMALSPRVEAAISSQPSFPVPIPGRRRNLGVDPVDLPYLRARTRDGECVRTLRYTADPMSPGVRLRELVRQLPRTDYTELPTWNPLAHSVLSDGVRARAGSRLAGELAASVDFLQARIVNGQNDGGSTGG